ncbi:MAG: AAA family ATPase [Candidatus Cohnella colombiensis]|uniref:AAA family ATPase n=1 Tax=Candidatus Cohnella colombiensis TaxID=3121368 RepID=A0AA95JFR3_9BACL|nr:MAG: AAA family ATPase [Cohnella sp.]
MLALPGYRVVEQLGSYEPIRIYRLLRLEDNVSVIAKTTSDVHVDVDMTAVFQSEYDQLRKLNGRGTLEPYRIESGANRPILLLRDPGGNLLDQTLKVHRASLKLEQLLEVAIAIVECVGQIHQEQLILHELNPLHLIVNDELTAVHLIDIQSSTSSSDERPPADRSGRSDSLLPYLSPEQIGRTGRVADHRSDIYSLGVILYEWFARKLPFHSDNALDQVHHHFATTPDPVYVHNPSIPRVVSDIVMKCMEKMPEARYESARGIKSDLEECLIQLRVTGKVQAFPLGNYDMVNHWMKAEGLFGRIEEQQALLQALKRVNEGAKEVVWISGEAGTGKTTLVMETLRNAIPQQGLFIVGDHESVHTASPYGMWIQILEGIVAHLLTMSQPQVEAWKQRIDEVVQEYGQLLVERFPRLALIIGEQPKLDNLSQKDAQTQFHLVIERFFDVFLRHNYPLVLFFDNLQRADDASLDYLYDLVAKEGSKSLLILVAYRESSRSSNHLMEKLDDLNFPIGHIRLTPYDHSTLKQLLSPFVDGLPDEGHQLIATLLSKTDGNLLLLKQLLQEVVERKLVYFDRSSRMWLWRTEQIAQLQVSETLANSLIDKFYKLPDQLTYVLSRAALIGKQFELHILTSITGLPLDQLFEWVLRAVDERILQPIPGERICYIFQHERIRQTAYSLLKEQEQRSMHCQIGLLLAKRISESDENEDAIYEVLVHLNQSLEQVDTDEDKLMVARLNLWAGLRAKESFVFEEALIYLRYATDVLSEDYWSRNYAVTFEVNKERAELEFLCGHFTTANECFNLLLMKAITDLEQAQICLMMIQLEMNRDNHEEVMSLGERALALLGIPFHFNPGTLELLLQLRRVQKKLKKYSIASFTQMASMTDERKKVAMAVFVYTANASFSIKRMGWLKSILTMLEMTMKDGMTTEASQAFTSYALLLNYQFKQYEEAYQWGRFGVTVSKASPRLYAQAFASFSMCYDSWSKYEPGFLLEMTDYAGKQALQSSDVWYANHSVLINSALLFQFGHPLKDIYVRTLSHVEVFEQNRSSVHWKQVVVLAHMITTLLGSRADNDPFREIDIMSDSFLANTDELTKKFLTQLICVHQYITGYILGDYESARAGLEQTERFEHEKGDGLLDPSSFYYYQVLVMKEIYATGNKRDKADALRKIRHSRKKLKAMAARSPENYSHKHSLVNAELARLKGNDHQARRNYELAIEAARERGFTHDVAIISECYAQYLLQRGNHLLAKLYINEAYMAYLKWGALVKTADMEIKVGHLLQSRRGMDPALKQMDYLTVMMSAQTLSQEMEMDRLLNTLMRIMFQNAGAEYGALIMNYDDRWVVEAYGTADQLHIESIPLDKAEHLIPMAIIDYTVRTKDEVVLHDAARNGMFERNAYIKHHELRSVVCLPIMHQNKLICLLYLANNLAPGVFTEERLDVLKLLSSQCAISIANAKLFSDMQILKNSLEDQVVERTHTLEKSMKATSEALAEMTVYAERNRIAQEIHDIVGHTLTSTILQIEAGKRLLHKDMDSAVSRLKEAQDLVRHSLNEIRNSVHMLKEDKYYEIGEALLQLIEDTEHNTGTGIHASLAPISHVSLIHKKVIYHALQEGLTNGIRHGGATQFNVSLQDEGSALHFKLEDNGTGATNLEMGFGLRMMRDRVQQLKGNLHIEADPDNGCTLKIYIPYTA